MSLVQIKRTYGLTGRPNQLRDRFTHTQKRFSSMKKNFRGKRKRPKAPILKKMYANEFELSDFFLCLKKVSLF